MKPVQTKAKIISNKRLKDNYWLLEFEASVIAKQASPGQFVNIKVSEFSEPLLRRPISIHRINGAKVMLFYEVLGKGTQLLANRKQGELLDIIGPLGNGFNCHKGTKKDQAILIAGGMGVAPLVFLAQELKIIKPLILIGAKTKKQILCSQEFKKLGCVVRFSTDDGSLGLKGRVTDLLKIALAQNMTSNIFACGPKPMLKAISQIACENNITSQLSLEEHMACGIGACLGCVVATKSGYKRVCKDGPIFQGKELIW